MVKIAVRALWSAVVVAISLVLVPAAQAHGGPQVLSVNCDAGQTIAKALRTIRPGGAVLVSGTCNENVEVSVDMDGVTLDGQGAATINGPDLSEATVRVAGTGVVIRGFTITGGFDGVSVIAAGAVTIDNNLIQLVARDGIQVTRNSSGVITNNTIRHNPRNGIQVAESSSARIGFRGGEVIMPGPNFIHDNGDRGIRIHRGSSARIYGNTISNNGSRGVEVARVSHADISSNDIDGNGSHGILVNQNSAVVLGADTTENTLIDDPNRTTVNNAGRGIRCANNSLADGRLGTLNGNSGPTNFDGSCVNSLIP